MFDQVFGALIASGPVAAVLGLFCWVLYGMLREERSKNDRNVDLILRMSSRNVRALEAVAGISHDSTETDELLDGKNGHSP